MRITIVGCGTIGSRLAKAADAMEEVKRIYLVDAESGAADALAASLSKAIVVNSVEDELYHTDLVIESADQDAAKDILPKVVSRGVDIMVMSVGALVDDDYRKLIYQSANEHEARIIIPSGALCGVDGLRSASMGGLDSVELVTTKGPKSLSGVKYLQEKGIDPAKITEKTVVFTGSAREAVKYFPKNVNVAATVALAGVGFDKTKVTVVLDPAASSNSHELRYRGTFGEAVTHTFNVPEPNNPKNSELVGLSATSTLRRICRNEWLGI